MKTTQRWTTVLWAVLGLVVAASPARAAAAEAEKAAAAEPAKPALAEPAVAKQNHVNVRAQAAIKSEVVARLMKDQVVTVLEEVTLAKPKVDEPDKWYRIALPTNATCWVHTDYVDPANKTVKPRRLNVRGGPSENYSVLGRMQQGETVKVVEEKGLWLRIEPPAVVSGFVAAHLLLKTPGAGVASVAKVEPPVESKATSAPVVVPVATEVKTNEPTVVAVDTTTNTPAPTVVPVVAIPPSTNVVAEATNAAPVEMGKRVVTREGLLRGSVSIQAPAYYELRSLDNNRIIDYIWSPSTNIVLRHFKGMKVVLTGEELLDERWPKTPVITVEEINEAP
jgi:uncharacterized protein YgiM (DUF1202 family)